MSVLRSDPAPLFRGTGAHWRRQYSRRAFLKLGAAVAVAGVVVYSGADEQVARLNDEHPGGDAAEGVSRVGYELGQRPWFLAWAGLAAVDAWLRSNPLTRWGRANFEAMVIGLPLLWTVQRVLGADRPSAEHPTPHWRPFATDHAASGHAFIGAVPWLNAARAANLHRWQPALKLGSTLSGWSRLHDRKHYLSQVWLGWFLAWQATNAAGYHGEEPVTAAANDPKEPSC